MLQSHGGSSLHSFPLAYCLDTRCVSLSLSLSVPPTHWTAWLALCPPCLCVTSISIPSALEGEDEASYHGSPYVAHLTRCDATLCFDGKPAGFREKCLHFSYYHTWPCKTLYLTANAASLLETVCSGASPASAHRSIPLQIAKINDRKSQIFFPCVCPRH